MSLPMNSDYEVISNAEVSAIISKYSPEMINMSLHGILITKGNYHTGPLSNMITSLETNFKIDLNKIPDMGQQMLDQRGNLYSYIIDTVCQFHNLNWSIPGNADIYTCAHYIYQFLVSDFYQLCVNFYITLLHRESKELSKVLEGMGRSAHHYSKKRYAVNNDLAIIYTNIVDTLNIVMGMDIDIYTIINLLYGTDSEIGMLLKDSITDTGDFFRNFYVPASKKPESITNIRLGLLQGVNEINSSNIKDYIDN